MKAEIVKRSFIVRLHRGLSNSKEIVLAYTECRVVEKVKLQPQEQAKSQDQRAGLQFPVGRIHRIIRHVGDLK